MIRVLTFNKYYLPGFRAGGPIRTLANMADHLGREISFEIITTDRDVGDDASFAGVEVDTWNRCGLANVYYSSKDARTFTSLVRLVHSTPCDLIYLNSFLDPIFSFKILLARTLGLIPRLPVVLAPRGEFSPGAWALNRLKKVAYLKVCKSLGFYRGITWQASSDREEADILRIIPDAKVVIARDLSPIIIDDSCEISRVLRVSGGPVRICFLSRISPKKNLDYAIRVLSHVEYPVEFSIYGPVSDQDYWEKCQDLISSLPDNIRVTYQGSILPELVSSVLRQYDLFFLPTRGENYGHVIHEALSAGLPVLISDQTPWTGLEAQGVGWALPLQQKDAFIAVINEVSNWTEFQFEKAHVNAIKYASDNSTDDAILRANRDLFEVARLGKEVLIQ